MVRVVNNSHYGYGYLENNLQLAKKVSELEQQLGLAIQEIQQLRMYSHQKDVRIAELESRVQELKPYKKKHDAIKDIVMDTNLVVSVQHHNHQTTSIQALTASQCASQQSPLRLPSVSHNRSQDDIDTDAAEDDVENTVSSDGSISTNTADESHEDRQCEEFGDESSCDIDHSRRLTENVLHPIDEANEDEDESMVEEDHEITKQSSLPSPSPSRTVTPINDSLEPADVTSVPPINQPERTIHTPSIWDCLDPLDSDHSDSQRRLSQQKLSKSPARNAGSSTSCGLRISHNINSSSPIHPITRKVSPNLNEDMFHSTPVQLQKSKAITNLLNKRSISDPKLTSFNQENCDTQAQISRMDEVRDKKKVVTTKKAVNATKKRPVRRAVKFTEETDQIAETGASFQGETHIQSAPVPATRYNLRKRAKV